jgi:hypothetical protein
VLQVSGWGGGKTQQLGWYSRSAIVSLGKEPPATRNMQRIPSSRVTSDAEATSLSNHNTYLPFKPHRRIAQQRKILSTDPNFELYGYGGTEKIYSAAAGRFLAARISTYINPAVPRMISFCRVACFYGGAGGIGNRLPVVSR